MDSGSIAKRIFSSQTGVLHANIKFATMTDDDFSAMSELNRLSTDRLAICDKYMVSLNEIKSISRRFKKKFGSVGVIVVDYIQLMSNDNKSNSTRAEELGKVSRGLKMLSKELKCPIVALSQLSRKVEERSDKRPMLADLRDSGAIEQDADTILFLYRDEYYHKDSRKKGIAEIIIAKNRNGETGTIELSFQPQIMRFMEKSEVKKDYTKTRK